VIMPEPGTVIGPYTILKLLGQGNMGAVYEAAEETTGQSVALKMLHPEYGAYESFNTRFEREILVMRMMQHPHIVPCLDFGAHESQTYFIMALIRGISLATWLQFKSFSPLEVLHILEPLCEALDYAHAQNVLHRDVKPSNILVDMTDETPFIYLSDFGLSKVLGMTSLTETQTQVGTPNYMSPEQVTDQPLTPATDVYALAIVAYEMLLHQLPFEVESDFEMTLAHIEGVPRRPSDIVADFPLGIESVLLRGLVKNPADRYSSARQFYQAFAEAVAMLKDDERSTIYQYI
jgi:serine/threonine protein kinase